MTGMKQKNTNCYKNCSRCNSIYGTGDLGEELMGGEPTDSCIEVYDKKYNLCPECTQQLWEFVEKRGSVQTTEPHIVRLGAYSEMAKELKKHISFRHATMGDFIKVEEIDGFVDTKQRELIGDEKIEGE